MDSAGVTATASSPTVLGDHSVNDAERGMYGYRSLRGYRRSTGDSEDGYEDDALPKYGLAG
jgi:hypothetical protein